MATRGVSARGLGRDRNTRLDRKRLIGNDDLFLFDLDDRDSLFLHGLEPLDLKRILRLIVVGLDLLDLGQGGGRRGCPVRNHGRRLGGGDQFVGQLLDQAFQGPEVAGHLLALVARLAFEIGAQILDLGMDLIELLGELVEPRQSPGPLAGARFAHRLIEPFDPVGEEVEPRHVLFDPVDALQVLVDHFERGLEIVQPVARYTAGGPGGARHHEIRGGHHHVERAGGDQRRNLGDAGMEDQPRRERGRRDRHGDQDDHIEHRKPSRGIAPPRGHDNGVSHAGNLAQKHAATGPCKATAICPSLRISVIAVPSAETKP